MSNLTVSADRSFQVQNANPAAGPSAEQTTEQWSQNVFAWFNQGNSLSIGDRRITAGDMARVLAVPNDVDRAARMQEVLGGRTQVDWPDFARFIDDAIRARPAARGEELSISRPQAESLGILEPAVTSGPLRDTVPFAAQPNATFTLQQRTLAPAERVQTTEGARTEQFLETIFEGPSLADAMDLYDLGARRPNSAPAAFRQLVDAPQLRAMAPDAQTRIIQHAYSGALDPAHAGETQQLLGLLREPALARLSPADRRTVVAVAVSTDAAGIASLRTLLNRTAAGGQSVLLAPALQPASRSAASNGARMLDSLLALAAGPISAQYDGRVSSAQTLSVLMGHLVNPAGEMNQATAGTCGPTTSMYLLATQRPAEYARLVADMFLTGGCITSGGATLRLVPNAVGEGLRGGDDRDLLERVMQSSIMQWATPGVYYDFISDRRQNTPENAVTGMATERMAQLMTSLYGAHFNEYNGSGIASALFGLDSGANAIGRSGSSVREYCSAHPGSPLLVVLRWGDGRHYLAVDRIDRATGRVFLRNPWGPRSEGPNGTEIRASPAHRVEDAARGIISVDPAVFDGTMDGIVR